MGAIVPPGDPDALADAGLGIIRDGGRTVKPRAEIERVFSTERTVDGYEALFRRLLDHGG